MSLVSDSLILLVWFLVFVIVLFLYVDVRVGKLRRELLTHYALCEKMVSAIVKRQEGSYAYRCDIDDPYAARFDSQGGAENHSNIFPRVVNAPIEDDLIPTADEMSQGLRNLDNLRQSNQQEHLQNHRANQKQPSIRAFDNWDFLSNDYAAPFRLPTW